MTILFSVLAAIILVMGLGFLAPCLPGNELLGGSFYQVVSILLAIAISAVLNRPMLCFMSANSAYKKGEYKKAVEKYKKAYKAKGLSVEMKIYCAYILLKEGDKQFCEEILTKLSNKKLNAYQKNTFDTNYALLLWKKGQLDEAIELLKEVWERAETVNVAGSLGALLLIKARQTGDYAEALEFCEATNERFTYERSIMANLGEAYYSTNRNAEALKIFDELTDCGITTPAPYYYYALALIRAGEAERAQEMLKSALRTRFSALSTVSRKTVKAKLEEIGSEAS